MTAPSVEIKPIDPNAKKKPPMTEKQKYTKMWTVDDYRTVSPGELAGNTFLTVVRPEAGSHVIDFGCGTGRGAFYLAFMGGLKTTMLDFAPNCLDGDVKLAMKHHEGKFTFIEHDLMDDPPVSAPYGYCTDVMEHIPPADVDRVLLNILSAARKVFFRISTVPDVMGPRCLNTPLHLTVQEYKWWAAKFTELDCTILHSEKLDGAVDFYVTAWKQSLPEMQINTTPERILEHVRENAKLGLPSVKPHDAQPTEAILLCGGPSLNDFEEEILEHHRQGRPIVTVNGAYNWCQERGIHNVTQCMLDARAFNRRFVEPVREDCLYVVASQCHPSIFEGLPPHRTLMWHCNTNEDVVKLTCELYEDPHFCNGGSTVALRAIVLLRILGFRNQLIYGMDSCLFDDEHHAYPQGENETQDPIVPVMIEDKAFRCHPWMALQAFEFIRLMEYAKEEFSLTVKGNGLIAHILETGATLPPMEEL